MELLSKQLPIYIQVNNFTEKFILEKQIQEKLIKLSFSTISKDDLDGLLTAASKKAVDRNASQIDKGTDMSAFVMSTVNSLEPVAQRLMVTMVSDKQGNLDSCYLEIYKTPSRMLKKGTVRPRLYIADSILKKNDLQMLVEEIVAVSTGMKK